MRRVHVIVLVLAATLAFAGVAGAKPFQAGHDYEVLAFPQTPNTGHRIEVREFFWYGCPHCFALEPTVVEWLKHKPADVVFVRTPAVTPRWRIDAVAFYTMRDMGVINRLHDQFFDAVHQQEQQTGEGTGPLFTKKGIADWMAKHGVNRKKFLATWASFGVQMEVNRAQQLFAGYNLDSVPNLVVNGQYRTSPALSGGEKKTMEVVDYLVHKVRAERSHRR